MIPLAKSKQQQDALELEYKKKQAESQKPLAQLKVLAMAAGKLTQTAVANNVLTSYLKPITHSIASPVVAEAVSMVGAQIAGHYLVEGLNGACIKASQLTVEKGKPIFIKKVLPAASVGFELVMDISNNPLSIFRDTVGSIADMLVRPWHPYPTLDDKHKKLHELHSDDLREIINQGFLAQEYYGQ